MTTLQTSTDNIIVIFVFINTLENLFSLDLFYFLEKFNYLFSGKFIQEVLFFRRKIKLLFGKCSYSMEYLAIYFCWKVYSLENLFGKFYSFAGKLSCSLENLAIFWNIQLFSGKVLFSSRIIFYQIWKRLCQKTCSFFEKTFSQPPKCIILFQLSISFLLLHPVSSFQFFKP